VIRQIQPEDASRVAEFLDQHTLLHRWLVAFFRNFHELPREAFPYWSLWIQGEEMAKGGQRVQAVLAHYFHNATTYLTAAPGIETGPLEELLEKELLPERLLADEPALEWWRARSPDLFDRAVREEELVVLALPPGRLAHSAEPRSGFRAATPGDRARLGALERLAAAEQGEEDPESDLGSIIDRGMVFVIEEGREVVGMVRSNFSDGRYIHLGGLYVLPEHRRRGLGARLLSGVCEEIHQRGVAAVLDVSRSNAAALAAYRKAGFRELGAGRELFFLEDVWKPAG
jgi:ribosomal protein S18 acetylase RimI-like enzyme